MNNLEINNNKIVNTFMQKVFYDHFNRGGGKSLELIISPKCNLACNYCYIKNYSNITFPEELYDEEITVANLKLILNWLSRHNYAPNIEIFSGEILAQKIGYTILDIIYNHFKNQPLTNRPVEITLPTNFTFLCSQELENKIQKYIDDFNKIDIRFCLSASFDGLYAEKSRPFSHNLDINLNVVRDFDYYDKVFSFCKKNHYGFHPMIYSKNIDIWRDNFNWFQELIKKHGLHWANHLYLLEVRNDNWSEENLKNYASFLEYLFFWSWDKCNNDKNQFFKFLLENNEEYYMNGFNILSSPFLAGGKISCAIQKTIHLRVADLKVYPCHRTMYELFDYGQYKVENDDLVFYGKHPELYMTIQLMDGDFAPKCIDCSINSLCVKGCLGAQYETTGDLFTPIPTVCNLYLIKTIVLIKCFKEIDLYDDLLARLPEDKKKQIQQLNDGGFI